MRRITKGQQPEALIAWKAANREGTNYSYAELPSPVKHATKLALLTEQGWLCGYTGIALTETDSHIEHFKPQRLCTAPGEDVEYRNLLAAYPGKDRAGDTALGFGAPFKADAFEEASLISPWSGTCEERFRFDLEGGIAPANEQDAPARHTIATLGLDHPWLVRRRGAAITTFVADPNRKRSIAQLERLLHGLDRPNVSGRLPEFCFALKQALASLLARAEKYRQQRAFARRLPPR